MLSLDYRTSFSDRKFERISSQASSFTSLSLSTTIVATKAFDDMQRVFRSAFDSGNGSRLNPYLISSINGLKNLRNTTAFYSSHFRLTQNLTFHTSDYDSASSGWIAIGNELNAFQGSFDGGNYTIHNLQITNSSKKHAGLFGISAGELSNFHLENTTIVARNNSGSLVAQNEGSVANSFTIQANISGTNAGGLVGLNLGSISASSAVSTVIGTNAGGLVGHNLGSVNRSFSVVNATGSLVGGLIGKNTGSVNSSFSVVNVTGGDVGGLIGQNTGSVATSYSIGTISGIVAGGLIGWNSGSVSTCFGFANVTATGKFANIGGLIGRNSAGIVNNCYAIANVSSVHEFTLAGGLIGYSIVSSQPEESLVNNSYAISRVSVEDGSTVAGFIGLNYGIVNNSFAASEISDTGNRGGFIGINPFSNIVHNSYYDSDVSGLSEAGKGIPKTTEELKINGQLYSKWDKADIWWITPGSYPKFLPKISSPVDKSFELGFEGKITWSVFAFVTSGSYNVINGTHVVTSGIWSHNSRQQFYELTFDIPPSNENWFKKLYDYSS